MGIIPFLLGAKAGKKHDPFGLRRKAAITNAQLKWVSEHDVRGKPWLVKKMQTQKLYEKYLPPEYKTKSNKNKRRR